MDQEQKLSAPSKATDSADIIDFADMRANDDISPSAAASSDSLPTANAYMVRRDGLTFAGTHLLVDIHGGKHLDEIGHVEAMLREAVSAVGATLLHLDLHYFDENGGISGVAVLAESHMSIHTWPEIGYAALDVFVCGTCDAYKAVPVFKHALEPRSVQVSEHKRGLSV